MNAFSIARTVWRDVPRVWPLLRSRDVPFALKAGSIAAALLILSPLDIFGDIPGLGLVDDAILLAIVARVFVALAGRASSRRVPVRTVTPAAGPRIVPR